jgi:hypothetical protein
MAMSRRDGGSLECPPAGGGEGARGARAGLALAETPSPTAGQYPRASGGPPVGGGEVEAGLALAESPKSHGRVILPDIRAPTRLTSGGITPGLRGVPARCNSARFEPARLAETISSLHIPPAGTTDRWWVPGPRKTCPA